MVMRSDVSLPKLFSALQRQLADTLQTARENAIHAPTQGASVESEWISVLRKHLPRRYAVQRAFVIDAWGRASKQLDVVIFDKHFSPFLLNMNELCYVPAESVYAVFEVKPRLDGRAWNDAGDKAVSVRSLIRTSAPIVHAGGVFPPRTLPRILAGILADACSWRGGLTGPTFKKRVLEANDGSRLELGCVLAEGAFALEHERAKFTLLTSRREDALVVFLLKLLEFLQRLGTVPAMDIGQYAAAIRTERFVAALTKQTQTGVGRHQAPAPAAVRARGGKVPVQRRGR